MSDAAPGAAATALLVIDVQRALFDQSPRPFESEAVVARINGLARRARSAGVPVVFVQHERVGGFLEHLSEGWQLQRGLEVDRRDHQVRKRSTDAFLQTRLGELLEGWRTRQLVVCGYATEFCIDTTVRRAASLGYAVTLAADAHTTHDKPHAGADWIRRHHNATLPYMVSFGPRIEACDSGQIAFAPLAPA